MTYGGWNSENAWMLAKHIDNNQRLYNEAWIVIEDYKEGTFNLMESVNELSEILEVYDYEYSFNAEDLIEYITENA